MLLRYNVMHSLGTYSHAARVPGPGDQRCKSSGLKLEEIAVSSAELIAYGPK